jgi:hypothetical protein
MNPKCKECRSIDIDHNFKKTFGCVVCNKCKNDLPEKYSLLTKTECKEVRFNTIRFLERSNEVSAGLSIDRLYVCSTC